MRDGVRSMDGIVSEATAMSGRSLPLPSTMRLTLAMEKEKVRKVNRVREARAQKGARIRAARDTRASLAAIRRVAEAMYPP